MFTTLRLKDSMKDVSKGPLRRGDALYQHAACVHCKRRKLRCTGDRPACVRCQSEGVNKCAYPERKPASPAKRKVSAACKQRKARKDSLSQRAGKEQGGEKWSRAETHSMSSMALENPIRALASASESDHGGTFTSAAEEQEQAMCKFSSLFEESPDLSMDGNEMMLLEASGYFSMESDTSDGVPSLTVPAHDPPSPSSTYDIETYLSPVTRTEPAWASNPLPNFDTTPEAHPSEPLSLCLSVSTHTPAFPSRCTCVTLALTAFHAVPTLTNILAPSAVEAALAAYKNTLTASEGVLRCETCSASTSAAITALIVSDELLVNLSRLRAALRPHSHSRCASASSLGGDVDMDVPLLLCGEPLSARGLAVGAYAVDSPREWAGVMDALVGVQLQRLEKVLVLIRVREQNGVQEEEVRALIVGRLEERLRGVVGRG